MRWHLPIVMLSLAAAHAAASAGSVTYKTKFSSSASGLNTGNLIVSLPKFDTPFALLTSVRYRVQAKAVFDLSYKITNLPKGAIYIYGGYAESGDFQYVPFVEYSVPDENYIVQTVLNSKFGPIRIGDAITGPKQSKLHLARTFSGLTTAKDPLFLQSVIGRGSYNTFIGQYLQAYVECLSAFCDQTSPGFAPRFTGRVDYDIDTTFLFKSSGAAPNSRLALAVPEPQTWLLAVFGFLSIGLILRRQRLTTVPG